VRREGGRRRERKESGMYGQFAFSFLQCAPRLSFVLEGRGKGARRAGKMMFDAHGFSRFWKENVRI
jgi:hypothetical protein